jgi:hypothetical protein
MHHLILFQKIPKTFENLEQYRNSSSSQEHNRPSCESVTGIIEQLSDLSTLSNIMNILQFEVQEVWRYPE